MKKHLELLDSVENITTATTRPKKKLPAKHPFSEANLSPDR